jgi:phytoene dehydrogenase-like protein
MVRRDVRVRRGQGLFGAFAPFVGHGPDDAAGAEISWLFASVLQTDGNKLVRGRMQQVSLALAAQLESLGGEIRTGTAVERIEVEAGRAKAVILEGGERVAVGTLVAASVDPAQLALRLLGEEVIGRDAAQRVARIEWGDAVLVIYAALDGPVEYAAGAEAGAAAHVHLSAASLDAMGRATNQCRDGKLLEAPVIVSWNDSVIDPGRVPPGSICRSSSCSAFRTRYGAMRRNGWPWTAGTRYVSGMPTT